MIATYLILVYLTTYLIIIAGVLFSHIFTGNYIDSFEYRVQTCRRFWEKEWSIAVQSGGELKKTVFRKLKQPYYLVGLKRFLQNLSNEEKLQFLSKNEDTILDYVQKLNNTSKAYFSYMVGEIHYPDSYKKEKLAEVMVDFAQGKSVHLRENSLKALYHLGLPEKVKRIFIALSFRDIPHSEKLLSDGLSDFTGNKERLAEELFESFSEFDDCFKKSVVNYLNRENIHKYDEDLKEWLLYDTISNDVQCAVVRLIAKNRKPESAVCIADYINAHEEVEEWEGMSVATGVLGNFERTDYLIHTLIKQLKAKHWYIRMNAADSLCKMGITAEEVASINRDSDSFAKDAINYAVKKHALFGMS